MAKIGNAANCPKPGCARRENLFSVAFSSDLEMSGCPVSSTRMGHVLQLLAAHGSATATP